MTRCVLGGVLVTLAAYLIHRVCLLPWDKSVKPTVSEQKHALLKDAVPRYRRTYERDDATLAIPPKVRLRLRKSA